MLVVASFAGEAAPEHLRQLEGAIAAEYSLERVLVESPPKKVEKADKSEAAAPAAEPAAKASTEKTGAKEGEKTASAKKPGEKAPKKLFGKASKRRVTPMSALSIESGPVCVEGEIFLEESHPTKKGDGWVLRFDVTDYTGSIRVSKYFAPGESRGELDKLEAGLCVTVYGGIEHDRYENDICLRPTGVFEIKKPLREDTAREKRTELHLHTRFSALDALTDPADAVKRAAYWGHKAVAITDHGVAQAFPDAWSAGKKAGIKVIFGLEGYFIDDGAGLSGEAGEDELPEEFVAVDVETTGLSSYRDRLTEIGAVLVSGGQVKERFQSFVNPKMPIPPEITRLTGITDADVRDAPEEGEALGAFLDFAAGRPLVAHNAPFDMGFLSAAAKRSSLSFEPVTYDTLTLSQGLLSDMRHHKLNNVAERLGLPEFNHHRAADDAETCGLIFLRLLDMLEQQGVTNRAGLEEFSRRGVLARPRSGRVRHIILLVRNRTGLKNLYEIISRSHLEHFRKNPLIPRSLLEQYREGLLVGSACEAGEVFDAVLNRVSDSELDKVCEFYDYLEIQPLCNNAFLIANGRAKDYDELRAFNKRIFAAARRLGKPVAATGDVHFLDPQQEIFRRILLTGKGYADADKPMPIYFKTTDEMLEEFSYLGKDACKRAVIDDPARLADLCENIELLPKGLFPPSIENSKEELEELVYDKLHRLYGEKPPELVTKRVAEELDAIIGRNYDVIYMSAQKVVESSLKAGFPVGSRGSVGSSVAAYFAGITEVNALPAHYRCPKCKYSDFETGGGFGCGADMPDKLCPVCGEKLDKDGFDIPFETFLGFGGDKVPDIDLNFSGEYQEKAHRFTEELFGRSQVFRAGTIGTLAQKTAFGYVKNYLEKHGQIVTKTEETRLSLGCVGVKRTTGQHPGGLVVIPQGMDVTDFCPVQHPADDSGSGIITTHFEYHCMEDNLLKLDELGHDDPTMLKMMEDLTGVSSNAIPLDDPETRRIFLTPAPLGLPEGDPIIGKTGTIGIPEFGTGFTRGMLSDTKPKRFETLVRLSGFSHGTDVWLGNAKELILSGTADISATIGCRDDIMLYLMSMGMDERVAFKIMEAVRKGRGLTDEQEREMRQLGVPDWYILSCKKIKYLFPKAHAVAYVMMAFRIAWFKVHEPLAFYSAYFYRRSQKDSFDAAKMVGGIGLVGSEIDKIRLSEKEKRATVKELDLLTTLEAVYEFYLRGFDFEPVDIYESDAAKFLISGNKLRPPFLAVSGLGGKAAGDLAACRGDSRSFVSIEEVASSCSKISRAHIEQLKALGAFGDLPETSQMSLF
jgi:DNA polymerase-3 subunit alpha (Gram-positive type)